MKPIALAALLIAACSPPPDEASPIKQAVTHTDIECFGCDSDLVVKFNINYTLKGDATIATGYWTSDSPPGRNIRHTPGNSLVNSLRCPNIWVWVCRASDVGCYQPFAEIDDFPANSVTTVNNPGLRDPINGQTIMEIGKCNYEVHYEGATSGLGTPIYAHAGADYVVHVGRSCVGHGNGTYVGNSELALGHILAERNWQTYTIQLNAPGPYSAKGLWNTVSQSCPDGAAFPPSNTYGPILDCTARSAFTGRCTAWGWAQSVSW